MDRKTLVDTAFELARLERLIDRLDPTPDFACEVAGCVHSVDASVQAHGGLPRAA